MKRIAVLQSNYIPWKGYFDLIDLCDEFVILDAQYTVRDWRNRNLIKTPQGLQWLTVPVTGSGWVSEMETADYRWARQHWNALQANYGKAPFFKKYAPCLEDIYRDPSHALGSINKELIDRICAIFGITTPITSSDNYPSTAKKTQRLVDICKQSGATHYLSGPKAKGYLEEGLFGEINVEWMEYSYLEYPQINGPFVHEVTILDLLFNCGPDLSLMRTNADIRRR